MNHSLGYLQRHLLQFFQNHPGPHTVAPDRETVLMVSANSEPDRREGEQ